MKKLNLITLIIVSMALGMSITGLLIKNSPTKEFNYKSHSYIYFPGKGVVHDPDCKQCILVFD